MRTPFRRGATLERPRLAEYDEQDYKHEEQDYNDDWRQEFARQRFDDALEAFHGSERRLEQLAEAASARAHALRDAHVLSLQLPTDDLRLPLIPEELRPNSSRAPVASWRHLDDAIAMLVRTSLDERAGLPTHASAYLELASACRAVAGDLAARTYASDLTVCSFCGERGDDARRTIVADSAAICHHCVEDCRTLLRRTGRRNRG